MVVLGGMGHIPGVILGAVILAVLPEFLRAVVEPAQHLLFGAVVLDPEGIRMLLFGLAMVCVMLFRPAGLWPSAVRKRELSSTRQEVPHEPHPARPGTGQALAGCARCRRSASISRPARSTG